MKLVDFHSINTEQKANMRELPGKLKEIQRKKIQQIIKHAYETVPYYNNLFKKHNVSPNDIKDSNDLHLIPVSTKQDIINAGDSIISGKYQKTDLNVRSTGGSSGTTLVFYQSYRDGVYAGVSYDRARMENGFNPLFNKIVFIGPFKAESQHQLTLKEKIDYILKLRRTPILIDMADNQVKTESLLSQLDYDSIKGYPSFLYLLAHRVKSGQLKMPALKHIFTASEMLDERTREFINQTFNADVKDIYGCWEAGCIGWECEKHEGYHINIDFLALQILGTNNDSRDYGKGNLILTNLNSYAVPFIRYQSDDIVELTPDLCSCGRPLPLIKSIMGRRDDFVVLTNGSKISPAGLLVVMHDFSNNVKEFQITQEKIDELHVRIVLMDITHQTRTEDEIKSGLETHLNDIDMKITVTTVPVIEKTRSGKHKSILSRI
ncbi:MAG: hypothetical protein NTX61_10250 [Bacteroidetes bacterium]|nr:hypothetical protein [Bacteroidota bacterium]